MKQRERILALAFGALVAVYAGMWLFQQAVAGPLEVRKQSIDKRQKDIKELETRLARARRAGKELAVWETQSLPAHAGQARQLYQEWLTQLIKQVGLADLNVSSAEPVSRKGLYDVLSFSVRGRGTLGQLVEFLFEFYRAGHLHQIQKLDLTPRAQPEDELDLSITIEALVLPGASRRTRLNPQPSDRLASSSLADYQAIVQRNLFQIGGNAPDATDLAYLTAVIDVNGQLEAWFTLRANDELLKLRQGESLHVGQFQGTIAEIVESDVVIESDGERWLLTVGENLAQANSLPPEF
jgi:hypothetical protein